MGHAKDSVGTHVLEVDPSLHDEVPLSSIIPPATGQQNTAAEERKGATTTGEDGYRIQEYQMKEGYQIGEYRSIYD